MWNVQTARSEKFPCVASLATYAAPVPSPYEQLLDATIRHLEHLQARGERFVAISPETLRELSLAAPRLSSSAAAPAPVRPVPPTPLVKPAAPLAPVRPLAPTVAVAAPALAPGAKEQAIAELRERALVCVQCPNLASSRKNVVFGVGDIHASLMFVGEAPGADEDAQGEPFVGAAGQLLTKIIQAMGLTRSQVYIANILKCRPDTPGESSGNRKPTTGEMSTCIPYLHAQIDLIQPKVIVALGGTALEGLLNLTGITKQRGQWKEYRGLPLMPTYHPSYLLRNQSLSEKRRVWEDMLAVMERLALPISEKQRRFFQPA